jgi:hypothetical protein
MSPFVKNNQIQSGLMTTNVVFNDHNDITLRCPTPMVDFKAWSLIIDLPCNKDEYYNMFCYNINADGCKVL